MKIATWNINSVRIRLQHLEKLALEVKPDIICLQETKVCDTLFPHQQLKSLGYKYLEIYGEKAYNGVAILSKVPFTNSFSIDFLSMKDKRHVAIKLFNDLEIHNLYIPAGGEIADPDLNPKFKHKLSFVDELTSWFKNNRSPEKKIILVGDLNIAPHEHDVWSHTQLINEVSHSPIEIEKMFKLQESLNWHDAIRQFTPLEEKLYTWWSYRNFDWQKSNRGRRLDHIWVTPSLKSSVNAAYILKEFRSLTSPSDHVPVLLDLADF